MIDSLLQPGRRVTDWGGMESAQVQAVAVPQSETDLIELVRHAAGCGLKVSCRGIGHSAGGQSFAEDALMIDMRGLNKILHFDPPAKTIRVQTGADWLLLTRTLEPHRLAISTKQEFDTFTIGGSLAANVHGKSIDYGPLIEHVDSFRLVGADGELINVSRQENPELFSLAIGGYGLFGIIVDVTFRLVEDRVIEKSEIVSARPPVLIDRYLDRIQRAPKPPLCYGFLDALCDAGFYVTYDYLTDPRPLSLKELKRDEPNPLLFNAAVRLQRWSRWLRRHGVRAMWATSGKPELTLRSRRLLLWDKAPRAFDGMLLQKYFVPANRFAEFVARVRNVFVQHERQVPVLMHHFRFVPGNNEAMLSPAPSDSVCLIPCYLARKQSSEWRDQLEIVTRQLLSAALELGGSYYLTFDILASAEVFRRAYPRWQEFAEKKRQYDAQGVFTSRFAEKYLSIPPAAQTAGSWRIDHALTENKSRNVDRDGQRRRVHGH